MNIEHRLPTVPEFITLRTQTDWGVPDPSIVEKVLDRSFSGIVAMDGGQAIGMARTVATDISFFTYKTSSFPPRIANKVLAVHS